MKHTLENLWSRGRSFAVPILLGVSLFLSAAQLQAEDVTITPGSPEGQNITNAAQLLDDFGAHAAANEIRAKLKAGGYSYGPISDNAATSFRMNNIDSTTEISTGFIHMDNPSARVITNFSMKLRLACLLFHENIHANQGYFNYRKNSFEPPAWAATINLEMIWVTSAIGGLPTGQWPGNIGLGGAGRVLTPQETLTLIQELNSYLFQFRAGEGHDPYYGLDPTSATVTTFNSYETYLTSTEKYYQAIVDGKTPLSATGSTPVPGNASAIGSATGTNATGTNGAGSKATGTNGAGSNATGTNGAGSNATGTNGAGSSATGTNGAGSSATGTNGAGSSATGTNGAGSSATTLDDLSLAYIAASQRETAAAKALIQATADGGNVTAAQTNFDAAVNAVDAVWNEYQKKAAESNRTILDTGNYDDGHGFLEGIKEQRTGESKASNPSLNSPPPISSPRPTEAPKTSLAPSTPPPTGATEKKLATAEVGTTPPTNAGTEANGSAVSGTGSTVANPQFPYRMLIHLDPGDTWVTNANGTVVVTRKNGGTVAISKSENGVTTLIQTSALGDGKGRSGTVTITPEGPNTPPVITARHYQDGQPTSETVAVYESNNFSGEPRIWVEVYLGPGGWHYRVGKYDPNNFQHSAFYEEGLLTQSVDAASLDGIVQGLVLKAEDAPVSADRADAQYLPSPVGAGDPTNPTTPKQHEDILDTGNYDDGHEFKEGISGKKTADTQDSNPALSAPSSKPSVSPTEAPATSDTPKAPGATSRKGTGAETAHPGDKSYLDYKIPDIQITNVTPSGNPEPDHSNVNIDYSKIELNYPTTKEKIGGSKEPDSATTVPGPNPPAEPAETPKSSATPNTVSPTEKTNTNVGTTGASTTPTNKPASGTNPIGAGTAGGSQAPSNELQSVANVLATSPFTAAAGAALSELAGGTGAATPAQTPSASIPVSFKGPDGEPLEGKNIALRLGNFKTATVSGPTHSDGKTVVSTGNIPPGGVVVDFYDCHNGTVIGVQQGAERPCPGATLIATGPIAPGATTGVNFQQYPLSQGNVATLTTISTANGSYVNDSLYPDSTHVTDGYSLKLNEDNQTYTVTDIGNDGESITITGVLPNDVGLPLPQLMQFYKGSTTVVPIEEPPGATVVNDPQGTDSQDGGAGSAVPSPGPSGTTPHSWVDPGTGGRPWHPHYQTAAFPMPASATMPQRWKAPFDLPIARAEPSAQGISYSIIANGNSTGEAFVVLINDPSGRAKTIPIPPGAALEPTGRRLAKPLPADSPGTKQPLNSYCLQFHKEPPAPGMLYRIAGPGKQQAYETVRYILAAIHRLNMDGRLHPDIELAEYLDAVRQYTIWSAQENWDQKAFTENWIERTKKNAQNLNVKWTKEMEKTLREAAPGRWRDISQARDLASRSDGAMKQALAVASKRETGKP